MSQAVRPSARCFVSVMSYYNDEWIHEILVKLQSVSTDVARAGLTKTEDAFEPMSALMRGSKARAMNP